MTDWLISLPGRAIHAIKDHPVVTALLAVVSLVWFGFGAIIGGLPFFGFVWLLVFGATWLVLLLGRRRRPADSAAHARRDGVVVVGATALVALVLFGLIQLVPFGRSEPAGGGTGEPQWATPRTRELMVAACFDCHSNQVRTPWYGKVAPVSWVVQHHVDEGRESVNFSNFATDPEAGDDTIEVIREGSMPPSYYTAFGMHPEAKLSDAEKAELIAGLEATPGFREGDGRRERDDHD